MYTLYTVSPKKLCHFLLSTPLPNVNRLFATILSALFTNVKNISETKHNIISTKINKLIVSENSYAYVFQ